MENFEGLQFVYPGHKIDTEKSDLTKGIVYFKEIKKSLTYKDITKELFYEKNVFYITDSKENKISTYKVIHSYHHINNSLSSEQLESILALNMLCNVAKYLNGDWLPKLVDCYKHYIKIDTNNELFIGYSNQTMSSEVYFKSKELAQQAIDILGKETIIKALTLNH